MARVPSTPDQVTVKTPSPYVLPERKAVDQQEVFPLQDGDALQISPTIIQKVAAEFIGTFLLVFIGCASAYTNQKASLTLVGVAFTWALLVAALVYTLGHVSGGHFNPAITIAFATVGKFPWRELHFYIVAQVMGSILASYSLRGMYKGDRPEIMLTLPSPSLDNLTVIVWEIIASFVLMWVVCGAASDERAAKGIGGAAIGAAIFVDVILIGIHTGASMNPARSLGPAIVTMKMSKLPIYLISPVIGMVIAATLYEQLRLPTSKNIAPTKVLTKILSPSNAEKSLELP